MLHPDDQSQLVSLSPRLEQTTWRVLAALAGVGSGPRRVWAGQPSARSPWLPCAQGCCLVLTAPLPARADPAAWLRFLVREVLSPQAGASLARAAAAGLDGVQHRISGEVLLDDGLRTRLLVAAGRTVRLVALHDDMLPVPRSRSSHGCRGAEVIDLDRHLDN